MKKLVLAALLVMCMSGTAEASWHDAIVIKQVKDIGACLLATGGGIAVDFVNGGKAVITSLAVEGSKLIINTATKVADCLIHTVDEVSPDSDPHPVSEPIV